LNPLAFDKWCKSCTYARTEFIVGILSMALRLWLAGAALGTLLTCGSAHAANLLLNPGFDTPSGLGPTSFGGGGDGGLSAAANWRMWNNSMVLSTTDQVASTDPTGGGEALYITTVGPENGVYQFVAANSVGLVSVDVFVVSGTFELGLGQAGFYSATATTSVHDRWVHLEATYPPLPLAGSPDPTEIGNEIFLYSTDGAGAEFYVDNAFAGAAPVPEPSTLAIVGLGIFLLGCAATRTRMRRDH
jgi:hypothetical protein